MRGSTFVPKRSIVFISASWGMKPLYIHAKIHRTGNRFMSASSLGELLRSWPRSLPLRDDGPDPGPRRVAWGWAEVVATQGLVLPVLPASAIVAAASAGGLATLAAGFALAVNGALAALRLGILAGTARAYVARPARYWLSPLADPAAATLLVTSGLRRRHRWRGRLYERRRGGGLRAVEDDE